MLTRLEQQLEAVIKTAPTAPARLLAMAQLAGVRARLGRLEVARGLVDEVRTQQSGFHPLIIGSLQVAEAQIDHYGGNHSAAIDHARRAFAIAVGSGDQQLYVTSAAWLATLTFIAGDVRAAVELARNSIERDIASGGPGDPRASLVIADSWSFVGAAAPAKRWYAATRQLASQSGDLGLQSSCLYNAAAFAVSEAVDGDCFNVQTSTPLAIIRMELETIRSLDALISNVALRDYVPMLDAELLVVERRWSDASSAFAHLAELEATRPLRLEARYLATRALCTAKLGDLDTARTLATKATLLLGDSTDLDDLARAEARLHQAWEAIEPGTAVATEHRARSDRTRAQFIQDRLKVVPLLSGLESPSRSVTG